MCSADIFLGLLAILFPPLPVWVKCGICSADSIINILLCMLGYIPGLIHAWYIIAKFPEPDYEYADATYNERGERVYVFVHDGHPGRGHGHGRQQQQPKPTNNMSYGTAGAGSGSSSNAAPAAKLGSSAPAPALQDGREGSSDGAGAPPPSYAQVVSGDNKVQSQD